MLDARKNIETFLSHASSIYERFINNKNVAHYTSSGNLNIANIYSLDFNQQLVRRHKHSSLMYSI